MTKISFVRLDYRLIHGQVITKWIRQTDVNKILVIDDDLSKDEFLKTIYTMAVPPGFDVLVYSVEEAISRWKNDDVAEGKLFILFKNVESVYRAVTGGVPIDRIQVGGLGFSPGRVNVHGAISLNDIDARQLNELASRGISIFFQQVPDEQSVSLELVLQRNDFIL